MTPKRNHSSNQGGIRVAVLLLLFAVSSCISTCARAESLERKSRAAVCFELELPAGPWRFTLNLCPGDLPTIEVDTDRRMPHGQGQLDGQQGDPLEIEFDPDPEP